MSITEARLPEIPNCQFPHQGLVPAAYDGKTIHGPWAYMCEDDFVLYGVGLGTGRGQRLIKIEEAQDE